MPDSRCQIGTQLRGVGVRLEASVCCDKSIFEGPWLLDVRLEASVCCDNVYVRVYLRKVEHNKVSLVLDQLHHTPGCSNFLVSRGKGTILYTLTNTNVKESRLLKRSTKYTKSRHRSFYTHTQRRH